MWSDISSLTVPLLAVSEADHPYLVYIAILAAIALVHVIDKLSAIYERFRSKPPADVKFATKEELVAVHQRVDGISGQVTRAVNELRDALTEELNEHKRETRELHAHLAAIHRAIGKLEGMMDQN